MFGNTQGYSATTLAINTEITEVAVCIDKIWASYQPYADLERLKFKDSTSTISEIGANYFCNGAGNEANDAFQVLAGRLIGFHVRYSFGWSGWFGGEPYDLIRSVALIIDTDNCE